MPIGTENESPLHRILKYHYAGLGGTTETSVGGFFAVCFRADGELIEIQTGNFSPLKKKIKHYTAAGNKVRIVHPIPTNIIIETRDSAGNILSTRKSPAHGTPWDLFEALCFAPELTLIEGVAIEILMVDVVKRRDEGNGNYRGTRHGACPVVKDITAFNERITLRKPADYLRFVPFAPDEEFTVKMLASRVGIRVPLSQKTLGILAKTGVVRRVGKQGNAFKYTVGNLSTT
jgi:hypothetical protein